MVRIEPVAIAGPGLSNWPQKCPVAQARPPVIYQVGRLGVAKQQRGGRGPEEGGGSLRVALGAGLAALQPPVAHPPGAGLVLPGFPAYHR